MAPRYTSSGNTPSTYRSIPAITTLCEAADRTSRVTSGYGMITPNFTSSLDLSNNRCCGILEAHASPSRADIPVIAGDFGDRRTTSSAASATAAAGTVAAAVYVMSDGRTEQAPSPPIPEEHQHRRPAAITLCGVRGVGCLFGAPPSSALPWQRQRYQPGIRVRRVTTRDEAWATRIHRWRTLESTLISLGALCSSLSREKL